jgi:hypothetical protein
MTISERWLARVTAVVDEAHAENLGGRHRSGFCEACAEAQLVAQRAVPDGEAVEVERQEVFAWARRADVPLMNPPRVPEAAQIMSDEILRLRKLVEPKEWLGWDQVDSIYDEARLLRKERDEARERLAEAVEALREYGDHQSWRCAHPPHWYLCDSSVVPDGNCPCGLRGVLSRFEEGYLDRDHYDAQKDREAEARLDPEGRE